MILQNFSKRMMVEVPHENPKTANELRENIEAMDEKMLPKEIFLEVIDIAEEERNKLLAFIRQVSLFAVSVGLREEAKKILQREDDG